jgi:SAM-dependent methyltransferase
MTPVSQAAPSLNTYEAMAPVYDRFTAHHDYDGWTTTLEGLARAHGLAGTRLLDAACGTGKSFVPMLRRGYDVVGVDLSPAMLAIAEQKAGGHATLVEADLRELELDERFDLVWCLCDAVNYLTEPGDLRAAVGRLAACLAPGGVLLFDCNNLLAYRTFFAETCWVETDEAVMVWRGSVGPDFGEGDLACSELDAFVSAGDELWTRTTLRHEQRHLPRAVVADAIGAAGLELCGAYGQHPTGEVDPVADEERHMKTVYVANASSTTTERR